MQDLAVASGRDLLQVGVGWVFSVATMPDDEMATLLELHYPTLAEAERKRAEHERVSGHSLKAWRILPNYGFHEKE